MWTLRLPCPATRWNRLGASAKRTRFVSISQASAVAPIEFVIVILNHLGPHVWRRLNSSGNFATFAAILRASSFVSSFAGDRLAGSLS